MPENGKTTPYTLKLRHRPGVSPPTTDSVLLSAYARIRKNERVCDLGAGSGILSILLAGRDKSARIDAVDISDDAIHLLRENAALYGLGGQITAIHADYRALKGVLPEGEHTLIIANPPYFKEGSGMRRETAESAARMELQGTVFELAAAACRLLKTSGRIALVFPAARVTDLLLALRESGLEPKRLRFVQHTDESPPSLVLAEGRKGGKPGLIAEPPLVLHGKAGYTDEYRRIYGIEK